MRRVTVLALGKLKENYWRQAMAEYAKRLSRYTKFQVIELPEARLSQNPTEKEIEQALAKEADALRKKIPPQASVISLCIEGTALSSETLAKRFRRLEQTTSHVVFLIGSSHGLSEDIKKESCLRLSLSPMTFPHQLTRVLLSEQIYRGFSINHNTKYHK